MLEISYTSQFKKDYKKAKKQGRDLSKLGSVLEALRSEGPLPSELLDHELAGNYKGHRECHLSPDWLLIYRIDRGILTLTATRLGSHSDLFS